MTCSCVDTNNKTNRKVSGGAMNLSSKPSVGVYYYPWYRNPEHSGKYKWNRAMRQRLKDPQEPKIGLYDSRDAKVIGEHIEQSVRGGIGFWAVSWWGPGQHTDQTFKENILKIGRAHV